MAARLCGVILVFFQQSLICLHFVGGPVLRAGARTIENAHDAKGVSQSDVEDLVEPKFADEPVGVALDASQLQSKDINVATAYHEFPDVAASVIRRQKETRMLVEETNNGAHCWFVPESHGCNSPHTDFTLQPGQPVLLVELCTTVCFRAH